MHTPVWRTRLRELIAAVERLDGQPQDVEAALAAFELLLAEARGLHPRAQRRLYLAVAQAFSTGALGDAYHRTEKTNQAVSRIFRRLLALVQDWSLKTECGLQMTEALLASPPYFPLRDRQALHIALLETLHGIVTGGTELHAA
ncbi:hypothetical protein GT347_15725 [Xylophilus rhododendri]|uniref:Uncharacterized protein n=1 Tax=Xylophilus rhododendri TaxID=2697032 RepID=A0A857J640_9BURK|nr:hypothetical protein [Xylophilus rhododendri]QHI99296.1 hypothetical protein GT347_15725 [Xylophilus rhododendri]